jgi:hypothetical protein
MKAIHKFFILFFIIQSMNWVIPQKALAQVSVNFQVFYDDLSPYGNWVDNSTYGYVWVPSVATGFRPYSTNGYWVFTEDGWTWYSDYSWGWAPFHYGRWFFDSYYGWVWVPDTEWSPAWVCWRRSDDYYGWAPIAPGISIDVAYSSSYVLPYNQWVFVRNRDFGRSNIRNYYVRSSNNVTIIRNTTVINNIHTGRSNNTRYNAGPDRVDAEKHAGRKFTPIAIKENNKAGEHLSQGQLQLYRPRIEKNNSGGHAPAPVKVKHWDQTHNTASAPKNNQPARERPVRNQEPPKTAPATRPTQHNNPSPVHQSPPSQQKHDNPHNIPPPKQQSQPHPPQQHNNPPPKQQSMPRPQQQHSNPAPKQQSQPHPPQQHNNPPPKQQSMPRPQQQHNNPPPKQQSMPRPQQQHNNNQPRKKDGK